MRLGSLSWFNKPESGRKNGEKLVRKLKAEVNDEEKRTWSAAVRSCETATLTLVNGDWMLGLLVQDQQYQGATTETTVLKDELLPA